MAAVRKNRYAVVCRVFHNLDETVVERCALPGDKVREISVSEEDTIFLCPLDIRIESHLCFDPFVIIQGKYSRREAIRSRLHLQVFPGVGTASPVLTIVNIFNICHNISYYLEY